MDIANIIRNALVSAQVCSTEICPADDIMIDGVLDSDWNGAPRIIISELQTAPEDFSQGGPLTVMTTAFIAVLSADRNEAIEVLKRAENAAWVELQTRAYNTRQSGIYSVTLGLQETYHMPDRTEFAAKRIFNILHKPIIGDY